jgi:large subunit ribosomal protein L13
MSTVNKTTQSIKAKDVIRSWHLIDAKGKVVGRAATEIAGLLMGKHKANYVSYLDVGDTVVVINAGLIEITGSKNTDKLYSRYSGYPGGLTKESFNVLMKKSPTKIIRHAVSGMLPKNKHRDMRLARLFIYKDEKHPYEYKFEVTKKVTK